MSPTVMSPSRTLFSVTAGRVTTLASCIRFQAFLREIFLATPGTSRISMSFTWVFTLSISFGASILK